HKRTEPWRFFLLDRERIDALADVNAERMRRAGSSAANIDAKLAEWRSMPGVMIVMCQHAAEHDEVLRKENYAACAAAAQNFQLHLFASGIASKWSTAACWDVPGFWELLGFEEWPELMEPVGIFSYGVPASVPPARRNLESADILRNFRTAGAAG
ncbi:MAG TPA: nitroreductase family protein, partial [Deinococcales bacterium]|nr:nitroreductase family protein [Deinococcales bacterium]